MNHHVDIREFKSFPRFKKLFLSFFPENYQDESMIDSCWHWEGNISSSAYGRIHYGGDSYLAHKMSYIIFKDYIISDQIIRHTCDNRLCVNPKHLILGSHSDNSIDSVKRNRQGHQKLNEECVKVIKWMLKYYPEKGLAVKLARLHNVGRGTIHKIKFGKTWSWIKV